VNVTEYIREPWLRRWISNPSEVRLNARMPALVVETKDRDGVINDIISYLGAMKGKKIKPPN